MFKRDYPKVRPGRCELHDCLLYESGDGYRCWPCEDVDIRRKAQERGLQRQASNVDVALQNVRLHRADANDAMVLAAEVHQLRMRVGQSFKLLRAALEEADL